MIKAVNFGQKNIVFAAKTKNTDLVEDETRILPNTLQTKVRQDIQKTSSAIIDYPVKGLKGDVNSNFYEFLTMGIVPYLIGSLTLMGVFNVVKSNFGKKMAMGVLLYGILKNVTKNLVTIPVAVATGIDTELPYQNKVYPLPTKPGENANIDVQYQQRTVFDSNEFYRKDLLDKGYFDDVAKRVGLGSNLQDSQTEVGPIIQNVVSTSNLAKNLTSYAWAGVGVAAAMQDSWLGLFEAFSKRKTYVKNPNEGVLSFTKNKAKVFCENSWNLSKTFVKLLIGSFKSLWNGNPEFKGFMRHSGKAMIGFATLLTVGLTANVIVRARKMAKDINRQTVSETKESMVM